MNQNKYSITHTNPEEINMEKVNIGTKGLVKYAHPKYGKAHMLVLRLPICDLCKYPIEYFPVHRNIEEKIPVNLKLPIDESFTKTPFYKFIQNILEKFGTKQKGKTKYPVYDSSKECNYIKIKHMDSYDSYTITEIINTNDFKIKTKQHKPSSVMDLYTIFNSGMQVVPYVMVFFHKTSAGDFVTLRPIKFYVGKNLSIEQIDYINKKQRYVDIPKSDFYDANQIGRPVSLNDFLISISNSDLTAMKPSDLNIIC